MLQKTLAIDRASLRRNLSSDRAYHVAETGRRERNKLTRNDAIAVLTASGQPYEVETAIVRGQSICTFKSAPPSLRALYEGTLSDKPFLVYEDERLSFKEAWLASSRIAAVLRDQFGVAKGDRVAISMRNYPEWMLSFVAVTSIGAIAVAMNALWQSDEMDYGLKDSGATVLIVEIRDVADDGYLYVVDRIKDMIIRGGENIGCMQVEDALMTHPGVLEAAVYAIPDGRLGEEVGATVFGDPSLEQQALRDYLVARLARFKIPRYITISAEPLPRIASGKIYKRQLREEADRRPGRRRMSSGRPTSFGCQADRSKQRFVACPTGAACAPH